MKEIPKSLVIQLNYNIYVKAFDDFTSWKIICRPAVITHPSIKSWDINMKSCQSFIMQVLTEYCFQFQRITTYCISLHLSTVKVISHAALLLRNMKPKWLVGPSATFIEFITFPLCALSFNCAPFNFTCHLFLEDYQILVWPSRNEYKLQFPPSSIQLQYRVFSFSGWEVKLSSASTHF